VFNKDAMEEIKVQVTEKVVDAVEQKTEEVEKKVDEALDAVQENTQKVADKIESAVEAAAKPITDLIDKLDDDPKVKAVLDNITSGIVEQVDGREFSCFCFGFDWSLRIARRTPAPSPTTPAATESTESKTPTQSTQKAE
jgi:hypothetical protein